MGITEEKKRIYSHKEIPCTTYGIDTCLAQKAIYRIVDSFERETHLN